MTWVSRWRSWQLYFGLALGSLAACSSPSSNKAAPVDGIDDDKPKPAAPRSCATPTAGCPCEDVAKVVDCGEVAFRSKDYVSCSIGRRTCGEDGTWGKCVGDQVITLNSWQTKSGGATKTQAQPGGVPADNDCDPYLFQIPGDVTDGTNGSGVIVTTDDTVTLKPVPVTMACTMAATITISPSTSPATDIVITTVASPPTPNTVQFTATLPACAGMTQPIWTVDQPSVATISTTGLLTLQYPYVGTINVTAYAGGISSTVASHITINATDTTGVGALGPALVAQFNQTCGVP